MMTHSAALRFGAKAKLVTPVPVKGQEEGSEPCIIEVTGGKREKNLSLPVGTRVTVDGDKLFINHARVAEIDAGMRNSVLRALLDLTNWNTLPENVKKTFVEHFGGKEADTAEFEAFRRD